VRIALLPLDGRPCNARFPRDLAAIAGHEVRIPPLEILGRYMEPASFPRVREWLLDVRRTADLLIVSVDMLCYGGIETSRDGRVSKEEALRRLETLREIPEARSFSVIMRATVTCHSEETLPLWRAVWEYNVHGRGEIPADVLAEYRLARERNRAVNLRLLELPVAERLYFQDDAGERGPHVEEARELARRGARMMPGADEAGMMMVFRAIGKRASFQATVLGDRNRVALYEDRSIWHSLAEHAEYLGCGLEGGIPLTLVAPAPDSVDRFLDPPPPSRRYRMPIRGVLIDCADANGADPDLMTSVRISDLDAFAAWNTASNSIGTALCHGIAGKGDGRFLIERLLDDWLYQSVVRPELVERCRTDGIDRFQCGERWDAYVDRRLHELSSPWDIRVPPFRAFLPWGRLFEVEIEWL